MTERERLIELLRETFEYTRGTCIDFDEAVEINADHLLANGVIVPICNVGSKVYIPDRFGRIDAEIERIEITERGLEYEWVKYDRGVDEVEVWDDGCFSSSDIGKTVFLSFEEYEKALSERSEGK